MSIAYADFVYTFIFFKEIKPVCQVALRYVHMFIFYVRCFNVVLVLFCDHTDLLNWLMRRNNGFASNPVSHAVRWQQKHTE
jgi:hypothetical protein